MTEFIDPGKEPYPKRMEKRINNLETIILEDEKHRKFDHSLSGD